MWSQRTEDRALRHHWPEFADEREGGCYSDRVEVVDLIPAQLSWLPVSGTRLIPR